MSKMFPMPSTDVPIELPPLWYTGQSIGEDNHDEQLHAHDTRIHYQKNQLKNTYGIEYEIFETRDYFATGQLVIRVWLYPVDFRTAYIDFGVALGEHNASSGD